MVFTSNNRRGQTILDMIIVVIILFAFALTIVFANLILSDMNTDIQADTDMSDVAKADLNNFSINFPQFMDNAFVLFLALMWVALIVTSFLVDTHPIFFILTIVLLVFVFIIGMIIANTYQDIAAEGEITASAAQFPQMTWVFENFLLIIISMGMTSALALYAKAKL